LEDLGIDGRITAEWISNRWDGEAWTEWMWFRTDRWPAIVNVVMNMQVSPIEGNFTC
jgi:hypothetical protein